MSDSPTAQLDRARALFFEGADERVLACLASWSAPRDDDAALERGMRVESLRLRQRSLMRLGRYADAVVLGADSLPALQGDADVEARILFLTTMAHAYAQMCVPEAALRCTSVACQLALGGGLTLLAASALECMGIAYACLGDCPRGERLLLEALGMVLQTGDDVATLIQLVNLMYFSSQLHDTYLAAGDTDRARMTLERCARFAGQGDRLRNKPGIGVWERCVWRSNRAGWLRRRGDRDAAKREFTAVRAEALERGWTAVERVANHELALIHRDDGQLDEALALLRRIPTGLEDAADAYDMSLGAHLAIRDLLLARHEDAQAAVHELAWRRLRARQEERGAQAARRLGPLSETVLEALAAADRERLDAEIERLRRESADAEAGPGRFSARPPRPPRA